ncbi:MAG: hemerythrin family protein [Fibrobacteres bacterium]|nr:hemerythrin family protein [Fibrobacterota bacterium]
MADSPFVWNERFSVGYRPIDEQHQKLLSLLKSAIEAVSTNENREHTIAIFKELDEYIQLHFQYKEAIMRTLDFPALGEHIIDHRNLAGRTSALINDFIQNRANHTTLVDFLREWWISHILVKDISYSEYVRRGLSKLG